MTENIKMDGIVNKSTNTSIEAKPAPKKRGRPKLSEEEKARRAAERQKLKEAKVAEEVKENNQTAIEEIKETPAPKKMKKAAAAKESNDAPPSIPSAPKGNRDIPMGTWNTDIMDKPENMVFMKVQVELLEAALGTSPNSKELLSEYIASKAPMVELGDEEVDTLDVEETFEKGTTIFPKAWFVKDADGKLWDCMGVGTPRDKNGKCTVDGELLYLPFIYNYQLRGGFKDSCSLLQRAAVVDPETGKKVSSNYSGAIKAYRKVIDGSVFVMERRIPITVPDRYFDDAGNVVSTYDENGNLRILQRPLRAQTPKGERISLAASEIIPAGSTFEYTIGYTNPTLRRAIIEWLNYGLVHGIGQWRNSGKGIFRWREVPLDDDNIIQPGSTNFADTVDESQSIADAISK